MVGITLSELKRDGCVAKAIVYSCEGDHYLLDVITKGQRYRVLNENREPLVTNSLVLMHDALKGVAAEESVMVQQNAYDEMIGEIPAAAEDQGMSLGW